MSMDDLERHLERLPKEAWDRPTPPPPPWPAEEERRARPGRRLVLRPVVAALLSLALVGAGAGIAVLLAEGDDAATEPARVALRPVEGSGAGGASGVAELRPQAGGQASVTLRGLPPSSGRDFYELWLLGADGELVSLGSVRVPSSGDATLDVQLPVDPKRFQYLDVSREPADGKPSHSGDSVLRGPST